MNRRSIPMNRRVLIVGDNPAIHDDFRKLLIPSARASTELDLDAAALFGENIEAGAAAPVFEMASAFQGKEALQMVEDSLEARTPYALAFVDMRMPPGWDGLA